MLPVSPVTNWFLREAIQRSFITMNLVNYLKSTHNEAYKEYQQKYTEHQEIKETRERIKYLSLMEVQDRSHKAMLEHIKFTSS